MTVEGGGFTLNGEAFEGGAENPVEGEGGRMYALTLADGAWTAAFVPMEIMVALGASEESVTLTTVEAGGYTMGGMPVESGGTATSSAGASYTLTMAEDGTWTAMFAPMTRSVPLGNSGMSVELVSNCCFLTDPMADFQIIPAVERGIFQINPLPQEKVGRVLAVERSVAS